MAHILIVDDEKQIRWIFSKILEEEGHRVRGAESGDEALRMIREQEPDLVFLDYRLSGMNGLEVLRAMRKEEFSCPVIMITAYESIPNAVSAIKEGAFDYLNKPLNNEEIIYHAQRALEVSRLNSRVREYESRISELVGPDTLVGKSRAIGEVMEMIARVAPGDIGVLIFGESGTGKEMATRILHGKSGRREGPLVTVDCGAVPDTLVESELFGHEKGSFTGAVKRSIGKFELADGGTLFLDEVGNASPAMQAKLLRAIEEKKFCRLGGKTPIRADARVIAATNRDLMALVKEGEFRQDLFYRLKGIEIRIPPLRERKEDISELVSFFTERYARQQHKSPPGIDDEATELMVAYFWPGNVRELRNVIERAVLLCGDSIGKEHLPSEIFTSGPENTPDLKESGGSLREIRDRALAEVEQKAVREALRARRGNKRAAARDLKIDPKTLYKLIRKYGL